MRCLPVLQASVLKFFLTAASAHFFDFEMRSSATTAAGIVHLLLTLPFTGLVVLVVISQQLPRNQIPYFPRDYRGQCTGAAVGNITSDPNTSRSILFPALLLKAPCHLRVRRLTCPFLNQTQSKLEIVNRTHSLFISKGRPNLNICNQIIVYREVNLQALECLPTLNVLVHRDCDMSIGLSRRVRSLAIWKLGSRKLELRKSITRVNTVN